MSGEPRTQLSGVQRVFLLDAACGLTAAESARKHGLHEDQVRNGLKAARRILGALSTTHAVALCLSGAANLDSLTIMRSSTHCPTVPAGAVAKGQS